MARTIATGDRAARGARWVLTAWSRGESSHRDGVSMEIVEVPSGRREELVPIDDRVRDVLARSGIREGVVHLWSLHTTCALTVNESADPDVARDMAEKMGRLAPEGESFYRHAEGNSDSHVKTSLFGPGLTLLVHDGKLLLGTWQGIFLCEWDGPRSRRVAVKPVEC